MLLDVLGHMVLIASGGAVAICMFVDMVLGVEQLFGLAGSCVQC